MNGETVEIGIDSALQKPVLKADEYDIGIVGSPANDLLGYEGVEGAVGPRFRKLSKEVRTSGGMLSFAKVSKHVLKAKFFYSLQISILRCSKYLGAMLTLAFRAGDRRLSYEPVMDQTIDSVAPSTLHLYGAVGAIKCISLPTDSKPMFLSRFTLRLCGCEPSQKSDLIGDEAPNRLKPGEITTMGQTLLEMFSQPENQSPCSLIRIKK